MLSQLLQVIVFAGCVLLGRWMFLNPLRIFPSWLLVTAGDFGKRLARAEGLFLGAGFMIGGSAVGADSLLSLLSIPSPIGFLAGLVAGIVLVARTRKEAKLRDNSVSIPSTTP